MGGAWRTAIVYKSWNSSALPPTPLQQLFLYPLFHLPRSSSTPLTLSHNITTLSSLPLRSRRDNQIGKLLLICSLSHALFFQNLHSILNLLTGVFLSSFRSLLVISSQPFQSLTVSDFSILSIFQKFISSIHE